MLLTRALIASLAVIVPLVAAADAPPKRIDQRAKTGTQYAQESMHAYGEGYAYIERAARLEQDAASSDAERTRATALKQARLAYEDALAAFGKAAMLEPKMYEAHTYLGYAHRKLGQYDASLSAYKAALRLKPDYARAIQYQGEAYLGLDRFDDAKLNYLRLYALDLEQAQKLLSSMHRWLDDRRERNGAASDPMLASAASWLQTQPKTSTSMAASSPAHW